MTTVVSLLISRSSAFALSKMGVRAANGALAVASSDWTVRMSSSAPQGGNSVLDPLIVCGPSGVGKGTIIERFMSRNNQQFGFTTSHTTRNPREGEIDTVHYNFVSHQEMETLIDMGKFLEHAQVHGNYYGTSWDSILKLQKEGLRCLLDIDVQGVKRIRSLEFAQKELASATPTTIQFQPKYVFVAPPSMELLEQRLIARGTEDEESLKRRTKNAKEELEYGMQEGNFDYVLVNDDLDKACEQFEAIVKELYGDDESMMQQFL
ncbi:Guanylate kinase [Seminavis robusta]|uniref:guanylate kinase n=1 Tax=Seminavis robusta TaxID=568900 RepID=A0A9N8EDG0_9STRA|nr:Guanylate kinase [Seminavis robusta]|eukprot:Sro841_g209580.1 Guanylate kinase (264) ;mRNA; f:29962-30847